MSAVWVTPQRPALPSLSGSLADTRQVNLDTLRDQVSYVFQEHLLMSESIRANLLLL